nr:hypothetical protein [Tanacetum cinerariifolium]
MAAEGTGDLPVPNLRTMKELCQPSLNGRGEPIALIAIQATNFGLKNDMIQQVQNSFQFHGLSGDAANQNLNKSLHVTQSIKVNGVIDKALHLYLFPHSLTHHATAWFDRLPRNSINTFEQMAKMFLGKYFPPSMVAMLRNEITNFCQRPDESLFEAWECYKLSIDRCPNHNMLPVTQIDTFYNRLTLRHCDTINAAAQRSESSSLITSFSDTKIAALKAEMAEINKNIMRVLQVNQQVKAVTPNCKSCGGHHSFNDCPTTVGQTQNVYAAGAYQGFNQNQNQINQNQNFHNQNRTQGNHNPWGNNQGRNQFFQGASHGQNLPPAYQAPGYQAPVHQPLIPQPQVVTTNEFTNFMKANDAILKNMQTNMTSLTNSNLELKNMFGQFMKMNTTSSSGSGSLPSNTITNPKEDLKGITTHSGTAYQGPMILITSSSLPRVVECETEATKDTVHPTNNESTKDVQPSIVQTESPILNSEPVVAPIIEPFIAPICAPKPNQRPSIPFADALILIPKFGSTIKTLLTNKDKLSELARTPLNENCLANKISLPNSSSTCMTLELVDHLISHPVGVAEDIFVKVGRFHFPADFVVVDFDADPRVPLILERSFLKTGKANYNDMMANRIDVIDMACEEYSQELLGFFDVIASGDPIPYHDPIVSTTSLTLTPFKESDFLLEEVDAFLALEVDPTLPEVD